jgi:hypothetical protein
MTPSYSNLVTKEGEITKGQNQQLKRRKIRRAMKTSDIPQISSRKLASIGYSARADGKSASCT